MTVVLHTVLHRNLGQRVELQLEADGQQHGNHALQPHVEPAVQHLHQVQFLVFTSVDMNPFLMEFQVSSKNSI